MTSCGAIGVNTNPTSMARLKVELMSQSIGVFSHEKHPKMIVFSRKTGSTILGNPHMMLLIPLVVFLGGRGMVLGLQLLIITNTYKVGFLGRGDLRSQQWG